MGDAGTNNIDVPTLPLRNYGIPATRLTRRNVRRPVDRDRLLRREGRNMNRPATLLDRQYGPCAGLPNVPCAGLCGCDICCAVDRNGLLRGERRDMDGEASALCN
jgi:hypothetical protein